jgi:hypothetical protein
MDDYSLPTLSPPFVDRRASAMPFLAELPYLRRDENLRVTSYNAVAAVTLTIRSRVFNLDAAILDASDTHIPNTDRSAKTSIIRTDEGWLLDGQVALSGAAPQKGQCFVVVEILRGESAAAVATRVLCAGYVTAKQPLLFPRDAIGDSLDGQGALRSITGTTPAAGANLTETVPTGARWLLLAFHYRLTASAVVATRVADLILDDGANIYYRAPPQATQTATQVMDYSAGAGVGSGFSNSSNEFLIALPVDNRLGAGHRIRTSITALDAGDQISQVQYLVREWIEGS